MRSRNAGMVATLALLTGSFNVCRIASSDAHAGDRGGASGKGGGASRGNSSPASGSKSTRSGGPASVQIRSEGGHVVGSLSVTFSLPARHDNPSPRAMYDPSRSSSDHSPGSSSGASGPSGHLSQHHEHAGQFKDEKDDSPPGWGTGSLGATGSFEPKTGLDKFRHPFELPARTLARPSGPSSMTGINPRAHQKELDGVLGDIPAAIAFNFKVFVLWPRNLAKLKAAISLEQPLISLGERKEFDIYMVTDREGTPIDFFCIEETGRQIWHSPSVSKLPGTVTISRYAWSLGSPPPAPIFTPELLAPLIPSRSGPGLVPEGSPAIP